jgi:hypothetical protein
VEQIEVKAVAVVTPTTLQDPQLQAEQLLMRVIVLEPSL